MLTMKRIIRIIRHVIVCPYRKQNECDVRYYIKYEIVRHKKQTQRRTV